MAIFSRENRSHQPSLFFMFVFPPFLFKKQVPTFFSFAVSKSCSSNHSFEDFIVELRICLPVPVPEFLRSFLVLPEVLPNKGTLGCKHLFWCNIGPALHTTNETQMEDIPFTTRWSGEVAAFFVSLLYTPFETSTVNVRVGQDYLPRPCFCAFGAFGTWIEMVAGLGMILGATWQMMQMGPDMQNPTL